MSRPQYSTKGISKVKELDDDQVAEVKQWMEIVMNESYPDFFEDLRDGVELCKLLNVIKPGLIAPRKFKKSKVVFVARTNIQIFIEGCKKLGIPETDCIETRDLFDQQNLNDVVLNLYALSSISHKHNFGGPFIGKKYAEKNKRNFSQEVLNKSKSAIPQFAKGGIAHAKSSQDGYGIVKTKKEMQNPSTVQGVWAKGSYAVNKSGQDGYGIVKTDKSMQNPSQVQGVWAQGSNLNTSQGTDSYGIVKTDKSMQNPSQVQGVWAQGANPNTSQGTDAYGIVKTDKSMQNPSQVQGVWAQGANTVDKGGMDSYGIVKKSED